MYSLERLKCINFFIPYFRKHVRQFTLKPFHACTYTKVSYLSRINFFGTFPLTVSSDSLRKRFLSFVWSCIIHLWWKIYSYPIKSYMWKYWFCRILTSINWILLNILLKDLVIYSTKMHPFGRFMKGICKTIRKVPSLVSTKYEVNSTFYLLNVQKPNNCCFGGS